MRKMSKIKFPKIIIIKKKTGISLKYVKNFFFGGGGEEGGVGWGGVVIKVSVGCSSTMSVGSSFMLFIINTTWTIWTMNAR